MIKLTLQQFTQKYGTDWLKNKKTAWLKKAQNFDFSIDKNTTFTKEDLDKAHKNKDYLLMTKVILALSEDLTYAVDYAHQIDDPSLLFSLQCYCEMVSDTPESWYYDISSNLIQEAVTYSAEKCLLLHLLTINPYDHQFLLSKGGSESPFIKRHYTVRDIDYLLNNKYISILKAINYDFQKPHISTDSDGYQINLDLLSVYIVEGDYERANFLIENFKLEINLNPWIEEFDCFLFDLLEKKLNKESNEILNFYKKLFSIFYGNELFLSELIGGKYSDELNKTLGLEDFSLLIEDKIIYYKLEKEPNYKLINNLSFTNNLLQKNLDKFSQSASKNDISIYLDLKRIYPQIIPDVITDIRVSRGNSYDLNFYFYEENTPFPLKYYNLEYFDLEKMNYHFLLSKDANPTDFQIQLAILSMPIELLTKIILNSRSILDKIHTDDGRDFL